MGSGSVRGIGIVGRERLGLGLKMLMYCGPRRENRKQCEEKDECGCTVKIGRIDCKDAVAKRCEIWMVVHKKKGKPER